MEVEPTYHVQEMIVFRSEVVSFFPGAPSSVQTIFIYDAIMLPPDEKEKYQEIKMFPSYHGTYIRW